MRLGPRDYLQEHSDIEIVGEARNGQETIELVCGIPVDVLMMDLNMPGPQRHRCRGVNPRGRANGRRTDSVLASAAQLAAGGDDAPHHRLSALEF